MRPHSVIHNPDIAWMKNIMAADLGKPTPDFSDRKENMGSLGRMDVSR
eukprot:CAMPEP_0118658470 /NCGR_PEP_ID=MMETSP0785-20121206/14587_1 /TAXON_ID=91992 /ORGANISM="Bolidomonas pacifica, Strain CCMP 1866" /LENGTH=47 /DNA_ID= /DNA_START= /DNA_END= /DNA_ORIENTATION=